MSSTFVVNSVLASPQLYWVSLILISTVRIVFWQCGLHNQQFWLRNLHYAGYDRSQAVGVLGFEDASAGIKYDAANKEVKIRRMV